MNYTDSRACEYPPLREMTSKSNPITSSDPNGSCDVINLSALRAKNCATTCSQKIRRNRTRKSGHGQSTAVFDAQSLPRHTGISSNSVRQIGLVPRAGTCTCSLARYERSVSTQPVDCQRKSNHHGAKTTTKLNRGHSGCCDHELPDTTPQVHLSKQNRGSDSNNLSQSNSTKSSNSQFVTVQMESDRHVSDRHVKLKQKNSSVNTQKSSSSKNSSVEFMTETGSIISRTAKSKVTEKLTTFSGIERDFGDETTKMLNTN